MIPSSKDIPFSALCSVYSKEKPDFLHQAFESLWLQTLQADEVVVVQDGPITVDLLNVIKFWKSKLNIVDVILPKNVGLGPALNIGLSKCNYDLVARFDTDDINRADRFEVQINAYKSNAADIIGGQIEEFNLKPKDTGRLRVVPLTSAAIIKRVKVLSPFNHATVLFSKQAVMSVGGYLNMPYMEDYYLWLRLLKKSASFYNVENTLVDVRVGNDMVGKRKGKEYIKSEWKLCKYKYHNGYSNLFASLVVFVLKLFVRLLPGKILAYIYRLMRKRETI